MVKFCNVVVSIINIFIRLNISSYRAKFVSLKRKKLQRVKLLNNLKCCKFVILTTVLQSKALFKCTSLFYTPVLSIFSLIHLKNYQTMAHNKLLLLSFFFLCTHPEFLGNKKKQLSTITILAKRTFLFSMYFH